MQCPGHSLCSLSRKTCSLAGRLSPAWCDPLPPSRTRGGRAEHPTSPEKPVGRFASEGVVYLVGAGPGAADLITLRGLRVLRDADVVLHDALISPELLEEAGPHAELVSVGKRGY